MELDNVPFSDLLAHLRDTAKIEVELDADFRLDAPASVHARETPLRLALISALEHLGLDFDVTEGSLRITRADHVRPVVKLYPVDDLVACVDPSGEPWDDFRSLIEALHFDRARDDNRSGYGSAAGAEIGQARMLIVIGRDEVHERVARKLRAIRLRSSEDADDRQPPVRAKRPMPVLVGGGLGMGFM